jgi:hypothetical protein
MDMQLMLERILAKYTRNLLFECFFLFLYFHLIVRLSCSCHVISGCNSTFIDLTLLFDFS